MHQDDLFANPKVRPDDADMWCVAYRNGVDWFATSRDHRWATAEAAEEWLKGHRHQFLADIKVMPVSELTKR